MVTKENGEKQPLLEWDKLEETLIEYSQTHFAHAEGSKFTKEPLHHLLQYDGLTPFGNFVTKGRQVCTLHNFDEPTKAILQNLHKKNRTHTGRSEAQVLDIFKRNKEVAGVNYNIPFGTTPWDLQNLR